MKGQKEVWDKTASQEKRVSQRLSEVFRAECVETFLAGVDRGTVLTKLVTSLAHAALVQFDQVNQVVQSLEAREAKGTTAVGKGLAFPHTRTNAVRRHVGAIGAIPGGVDFSSLDGLPTRLVFVLLSPQEETAKHLRILEQLAVFMTDRALHGSLQIERSPEALLALIGIADDESIKT
jgi:PTS system fructose-specific IIA component/PTS system nitrogen regulatory IIA component